MGFGPPNDAPVLSLPPTLYTVSGVPFAVYFRNLIRSDHPWDRYGIDVDWTGPVDGLGNDATQTAHQQQNERWVIMPKDADVAAGNLFTSPCPFSLKLFRGDRLAAAASATVKIAKSTAGGTGHGGQYLRNGQFELPGLPGQAVAAPWACATDGDATFQCDATDKKFGTCAGKLAWPSTGTYGAATTHSDVALAANAAYQLSFWYKGGPIDVDLTYYNGSSYVYAADFPYTSLPAAAEWTFFSHALTTGGSAGIVNLLLYKVGKGTVRFDNVQLQKKASRCLLPVGDSTGYTWPAEIVNLSKYNRTAPTAGGGADALAVTLLGSMTGSAADSGGTSRNIHHEGHGGMSWNNFYSSPYFDPPTNAVPNPFLSGGVFNFAAWNETQIAAGVGLGTGDWVTVLLGINDWVGQPNDAAAKSCFAALKPAIDGMIASISSAVPGIRVGLILALPAGNQDGAGHVQRASNAAYRHQRNAQLFAEYVIANYGGREADGICLIPSCNLDAVNNYSFQPAAKINDYSATMISRQNDYIHPDTPAGCQLAAAVWAAIKCLE